MSRYQPYPSYKASGVKWLGEVPEKWKLAKLKHVCRKPIAGGTPKTDDEKYWCDSGEGVPWVSIADLTANSVIYSTKKDVTQHGIDSKNLSILPAGTLLYSIFATLGKVSEAGVPLTTNQAILGLLPEVNFEKRFLHWVLTGIESYVKYTASSNTQDNLNSEKVSNLPIVVPFFEEQTAIANFLDRETAKIDTLIAKQERMIELLNEKRSALISHAVTKGIDLNVKMKDSGVEWLGEVPEHWEIIQSRRLFKERKDRAIEGDEQLTASQKYGIISQKEFMELEGRRVVQVITGSEILKRVEPNDFVISMRSFQGGLEWCGRVGSMSSAYIALIPIKHVIPRYFTYLFKCQPYIQALQSTSNLVRDGQALRFENFSLVSLMIVPENEQIAIADYLDTQTTKIDTLIAKARQAIELMKERRTALISAVVTGKIDVRGMA